MVGIAVESSRIARGTSGSKSAWAGSASNPERIAGLVSLVNIAHKEVARSSGLVFFMAEGAACAERWRKKLGFLSRESPEGGRSVTLRRVRKILTLSAM